MRLFEVSKFLSPFFLLVKIPRKIEGRNRQIIQFSRMEEKFLPPSLSLQPRKSHPQPPNFDPTGKYSLPLSLAEACLSRLEGSVGVSRYHGLSPACLSPFGTRVQREAYGRGRDDWWIPRGSQVRSPFTG